MMMKKDHKTDLQHTKFQILTATDKKPIENSMIKTTSTEGIMVGYTDAKGFVNLGPFLNGEKVTVEVEIKGYDRLVQEFIFSNSLEIMTLEMTERDLPIKDIIPDE